MKVLRPLFALALTSLGLALCRPARAAGVDNASFEVADTSGAMPRGWSTNAWGSVTASFSYVSSAHDGARGARVDVSAAGASDTGDAKWISDPFTPDPADAAGATYLVSDWYRASVPTRLMLNASDGGSQQAWITVAEVSASPDWRQARGSVVLPPWATAVRMLHVIDVVGWLETDSFDMGYHPPSSEPPLVSITFDDGWRSGYELLVPRLDAMHYPATHFIISDFVDNPQFSDLYFGASEIRSLIVRGHEIQSHTATHPDLVTLSPDALTSELTRSKNALETLMQAPVRGLAFPYGSYDHAVRDRAASIYAYSRTLKSDLNVPPYDVHELNATVVSNTFSVDDLAAVLESAQAADAWTILVFHRASEDAPLDTFVRPQVFQQMLDLLAQRHARVRTMGDVLGVWSPPVAAPDAGTSLEAGLGRDAGRTLEASASAEASAGEASASMEASAPVETIASMEATAPMEARAPVEASEREASTLGDASFVGDGSATSEAGLAPTGSIDTGPASSHDALFPPASRDDATGLEPRADAGGEDDGRARAADGALANDGPPDVDRVPATTGDGGTPSLEEDGGCAVGRARRTSASSSLFLWSALLLYRFRRARRRGAGDAM